MKKTLLLASAFIVITAAAQPVLQEANFAKAGFSATVNAGSTTSPGSNGANQTWNFSSLFTLNAGTMSVVNPSSTSCFSTFPSSNYAWLMPPGPKANYYMRSSTDLQLMGDQWPSNCTGGTTYSNYLQVFKFPFSYTNTYNDTYTNNNGSGTSSFTYDGYGTLITAFGTYTNVIRITIVEGSSTTTEFLTSGNPSYPVVIITPTNTIIFSGATVGIDTPETGKAISVSPNPSNGIFSVNIEKNMLEADLEVYNMIGKKVYSTKMNAETTSVDLSAQAKGVYFYQLKKDGVVNTGKLVVE